MYAVERELLLRVRAMVQAKRDALATANNLFMWRDADEVLRLLDTVLERGDAETGAAEAAPVQD
jgi:hypothetical protein